MISNQDDEFIAVRVQDPRVQNEDSWNSYVDYKIFLHTNSKAFTAKTSCVRRRYSEFVWLKKQLQKNAGLVPVPNLPAKSLFYFSNEDFLEGRRKGLQAFLDKVVHMTVCLSDSQLHLFLQTQLPVGHIQDCVQGHTPYTVTDAILTYASSNQGLAQAQEDEPKESSLAISYESMESPLPHQPSLPAKEEFRPDLLPGADSDHVQHFSPASRDESELKEKPLVRVVQKDQHMEAVLEECGATGVSFFVGDEAEPQSSSLEEQNQPRSCRIQTPVQVHSPAGPGLEDGSESQQRITLKTVPSDPEEPDDLRQADGEMRDGDAATQDVPEDDGSEQVLEMNAGPESVTEVKDPEPEISVEEVAEDEDKDEDGHSVLSSNGSIIKVSDEDSVCEDVDDLNEDEKCYMKTSGEEMPLWSADDSIGNIMDLHLKGCPPETEQGTTEQGTTEQGTTEQGTTAPLDVPEAEALRDKADIIKSTLEGGDQMENSDFSVIETSCSPGTS